MDVHRFVCILLSLAILRLEYPVSNIHPVVELVPVTCFVQLLETEMNCVECPASDLFL